MSVSFCEVSTFPVARPVFDRNQYAISVGAISRAGGVDDLLHSESII